MKTITVHELQKKLEDDTEDTVVIDVREPFEHTAGTIPVAENVPLDDLQDAVEKLKNVGTVYVHCRTGGRSTRACQFLEEHGVDVVNIEGGLEAWETAGFPIRKDA